LAQILRIVSPDALQGQEVADDRARVAAEEAANQNSQLTSNLSAFIDNEFNEMVRHRDGASGWSDRMVNAMRVFNGQYDATKLAEIKRFGGSDIYARLIATKCRGATSLLRDVYLNTEKPWGLKPTPDPSLPDDIMSSVMQLVQVEAENMKRLGQPPTPDMISDRTLELLAAAKRAGIKKARSEAETAFNKVDDILVEAAFTRRSPRRWSTSRCSRSAASRAR